MKNNTYPGKRPCQIPLTSCVTVRVKKVGGLPFTVSLSYTSTFAHHPCTKSLSRQGGRKNGRESVRASSSMLLGGCTLLCASHTSYLNHEPAADADCSKAAQKSMMLHYHLCLNLKQILHHKVSAHRKREIWQALESLHCLKKRPVQTFQCSGSLARLV